MNLTLEKNLRTEAEKKATQMEQTLESTRRRYEEMLETSNRRCLRLQIQHNECCKSLASTEAQVKSLNSNEICIKLLVAIVRCAQR